MGITTAPEVRLIRVIDKVTCHRHRLCPVHVDMSGIVVIDNVVTNHHNRGINISRNPRAPILMHRIVLKEHAMGTRRHQRGRPIERIRRAAIGGIVRCVVNVTIFNDHIIGILHMDS